MILIVEHFSHFPQAYAAKDYSAETAAKVLFKHYVTFGVFDELASDPGSSFMSDVVSQLNQWLGVRHKVSLVERHESNGCEGSGKQFIRHLRTLVSDERMLHKWSDETILPLINFEMASFPTKETGGFTPFQLKYGTQDAKYFMLPEPLEPGAKCHALLRKLDEDIKTVREVSRGLQEEIAAERAAESELVPRYEPGDFVLWNPKETPCSHLESKLAPSWMGPYEVIEQVKNDVECVHISLRTCNKFHVSRLKPFLAQERTHSKWLNWIGTSSSSSRSLTFMATRTDGHRWSSMSLSRTRRKTLSTTGTLLPQANSMSTSRGKNSFSL